METITRLETRIVHLARSPARRVSMQAELQRVGIIADDWAAVDGRDPAHSARLADVPDQGPWGPMGPHEKGCLLSHLDALRAFLAGEASHLLMFEDDVFLADDLALWLAGDWCPTDADLVKLERWRDDRLLVLMDRQHTHHAGRALRRLRSRHSGAAGYILTRDAALRVLNENNLSLPVDHLLFNPTVSELARSFVTYQVTPALVVQGNDSTRPLAAVPVTGPRPAKTLAHKLKRGLAELRALRALPYLLSRRADLTAISWARHAPQPARPASDFAASSAH